MKTLFTSLVIGLCALGSVAQPCSIDIKNNSYCDVVITLLNQPQNNTGCQGTFQSLQLQVIPFGTTFTYNAPAGENVVGARMWWDPVGCPMEHMFDIGDAGLCQNGGCNLPNFVISNQMTFFCGCAAQPNGVFTGTWTCTTGGAGIYNCLEIQ